jgi:hypothetical protein
VTALHCFLSVHMATDTSRKGTQVNGSLWLVGKVIAKHAPFQENENNYNEATTSSIHVTWHTMVCSEHKHALWTETPLFLLCMESNDKKKKVFTAMLIHLWISYKTSVQITLQIWDAPWSNSCYISWSMMFISTFQKWFALMKLEVSWYTLRKPTIGSYHEL